MLAAVSGLAYALGSLLKVRAKILLGVSGRMG